MLLNNINQDKKVVRNRVSVIPKRSKPEIKKKPYQRPKTRQTFNLMDLSVEQCEGSGLFGSTQENYLDNDTITPSTLASNQDLFQVQENHKINQDLFQEANQDLIIPDLLNIPELPVL